MPRSELVLLTAMGLVLVIWPAVVLGIEVGWLLGLNSWHFRPDR